VLKFLWQNSIHLIILPAHSSHILQPLDLTLNRLVKERYRKEYALAESQYLAEKRKIKSANAEKEEDAKKEEASLTEPKKKRQKIEEKEERQKTRKTSKKVKKGQKKDGKRKNRKARNTTKKSYHKKQKTLCKPSKKLKSVQEPTIAKENSAGSDANNNTTPGEVFSELTLAERRVVMLDAAVNAVMSSLILRTIRSAWKASGLYPLMEHPPYSREKAEDLRKQAMGLGVLPEGKRRVVLLTGVLSDPEAIRNIESVTEKKGKLKGSQYKYMRTIKTPLGTKVKFYEVCASLADVGDYYLDGEDEDVEIEHNEVAEIEGPLEPVEATMAGGLTRKRGRPKKQKTQQPTLTQGEVVTWLKQREPDFASLDSAKVKGSAESQGQGDDNHSFHPRPRGRPRKHNRTISIVQAGAKGMQVPHHVSIGDVIGFVQGTRRTRGRPRKQCKSGGHALKK